MTRDSTQSREAHRSLRRAHRRRRKSPSALRTGRITGLIGPNGAGKTSFFNACSGLVPVAEGSVALDGQDLTGDPPAQRAQRGLGRTFQRMELFNSLTVRENVALAHEAGLAGSNPLRHLFPRPGDQRPGRGPGRRQALGSVRHREPRRPQGRYAAHRPAPTARTGPGPRRRLPDPAPRRAVIGPRHRRDRAVRPDPAGGRGRAGRRDPDRRARHGTRHGAVRLHLRPRLRRADLRGRPGRGAGQPGRPGRLPRRRQNLEVA